MKDLSFFTLFAVSIYLAGLVCAVFALFRSRSPQGSVAWILALVAFPFVAVPLFLIFGRNKFLGYIVERKELDDVARKEMAELDRLHDEQVTPSKSLLPLDAVIRDSRQPAFTGFNSIELLVDGDQTYSGLFDGIEKAESYILFQFYIFRFDQIGMKFVRALKKKAQEGVRVYFLYDGIGTYFKSSHLKEMEAAGIRVGRFQSSKAFSTPFQINFRNHRKIVVVDGKTAFVGGFNIGDDYLGRWKNIGDWRDTHTRITGPAALAAQLSFVKDWFWVKEELLDLDWEAQHVEEGSHVLVLHTGPVDDKEYCLLIHIALINSAVSRIWIANPYIVPPESLMSALSLAALRGLDVRILVPSYSDNFLVTHASEIYIEKLLRAGIKIYKYSPGFLHQKVIVIDNEAAAVGSVNLDSRSIFINFEIMAITSDQKFVSAAVKMLEHDFARSDLLSLNELHQRSFARQLISRAASLLSPIL